MNCFLSVETQTHLIAEELVAVVKLKAKAAPQSAREARPDLQDKRR